eukprot:10089.XXX_11985_12176_1 [CDS] Oithona nana genome sequencing.
MSKTKSSKKTCVFGVRRLSFIISNSRNFSGTLLILGKREWTFCNIKSASLSLKPILLFKKLLT